MPIDFRFCIIVFNKYKNMNHRGLFYSLKVLTYLFIYTNKTCTVINQVSPRPIVQIAFWSTYNFIHSLL